MNQPGGVKNIAKIMVCLALLFLTACAEPGVEIADSWVIFTAEQIAADVYWPNNDDPWTPSAADVLAVEEELDAFLLEENPDLARKLSGYSRQYWGTVTESGNRAIYGNFFCNEDGTSDDYDWRTKLVQGIDGGDCYFQTLYDVEDDAFVRLSVNGEA